MSISYKQLTGWLVFIIFVLLIFMVVNLPTRVVLHYFDDKITQLPIKVTKTGGTIWQGNLRLETTKELPLVQASVGQIRWQIQWKSLLQFIVQYDVYIEGLVLSGLPLGDFEADIQQGETRSAQLKDSGSGILILQAQAEETSTRITVEGSIKTRKPTPQLDAILALGSGIIKPDGSFFITVNK